MKRILATLLAVCMVLSMLVVVPFTATAEVTGADEATLGASGNVGYQAVTATVTKGTYTDLADAASVTEAIYEISSVAGLQNLATFVNGGVTFEGVTIYLVNSVDFGETVFAGIGTVFGVGNVNAAAPATGFFKGTLNGQGYTITAKGAAKETASYLFNYVGGNAKIQNLQLAGSNVGLILNARDNVTIDNVVTSAGVCNRARGLAAFISWVRAGEAGAVVTIKNSSNTAKVEGLLGTACMASGFVGEAQASVWIENCLNTGMIDGVGYSASFLGFHTAGTATIKNCKNAAKVDAVPWSGGIVGTSTTTLVVLNCTNEGAVGATGQQGTNSKCIGGIAGQVAAATFENCYNAATATVTNPQLGGSLEGINTGGIVGLANGIVTISNCKNDAAVTVYNSVKGSEIGGIVGYMVNAASVLENCTNTGNVSGTAVMAMGGIAGTFTGRMVNALNTGKVSDLEGGSQVGGIIGKIGNNATLTNVKNTADVEATAKGTKAGTLATIDTGSVGGYQVAGIVGVIGAGATTFIGCSNSGNVSSNGWHKSLGTSLGGVVGSAQGTGVTMTDCTNSGAITSIRDRVGGIVGNSTGAASNSFTNCSNTGAITGGNHVGGVIGYAQPNGGLMTTVQNSSNYGTITATGNAAGIVGCGCIGITIKDSVNKGNVKGGNAAGIIGLKATATDPITVTGCSNYAVITASGTSNTDCAGIFFNNAGASVTTCTNNVDYVTKTQWVGYQTRTNEDSTIDLRLVGSIDNINYNSVGFDIAVSYMDGDTLVTKTLTKSLTKAYSELLAAGDPITAPAYRGADARLFALVIEDLPTGVELTFNVTTYSLLTYDAEIVNGESATFTVTLG